jgi:predicted metal-dependent TIM-barrel fold hydrolase
MPDPSLITLIVAISVNMQFDPNIALAVAKVESNYNTNAVGALGEIGIFQLRSEYITGYTKEQLFDPEVNIKLAILKMKRLQKTCVHNKDLEWLTCWNVGETGAKNLKYPRLFPYYLKVSSEYNIITGNTVANN